MERVPCCSVLQCVAVSCSVLQCVTITNVVSVYTWNEYRVAACCSVLQYVAECCSVLPLPMWYQYTLGTSTVLQCVAACCSVLQSVAVCYPWQCGISIHMEWVSRLIAFVVVVAVCCSVLQCVAVCCSVLQCVAVWYSVSIAFIVVNISPITISCQRRRGGVKRSVWFSFDLCSALFVTIAQRLLNWILRMQPHVYWESPGLSQVASSSLNSAIVQRNQKRLCVRVTWLSQSCVLNFENVYWVLKMCIEFWKDWESPVTHTKSHLFCTEHF